ncbi:PBSX family phage terminase large subunit [Acinetobacter radioresistens]|uniref:PBSX family phage terminase large subunit n=1 Tax=Acinetobacter radioresistens TaxID=40216 RepID=UPI0022469FE7|nr:PBSX family phage terminase large subunit [Acinetobacter radioresistens]MCX0343630.1 PBSX family phage terminase large subunit [Acinetobacter radioresistens]
MSQIKVPTKFKSLYLYESNPQKLFYVFHGGRAGGKSWEIARFLLIEGTKKPHRILCCRETLESIEDSIHALLKDWISRLNLGWFYEVLDKEIRGANGTLFVFKGLLDHTAERVKSFEGATITWVEEAQTVGNRSLELLIPTVIRTERPLIIFSLNPKLPSDPVYRNYIDTPREDTEVISVNYYDNPNCPPEITRIAEMLKESSFDEYEHIYLGVPKTIADGAIYKAEFELIKKENRICRVPHEPNLPVYTSWDLGILDPTAIWFFQIYGKEVRVIDYYEANNEPLSHYARILDEKASQLDYRYEKHFAPHDIAARDLSSGVSREQTMATLGYRMSKGARLGVEDRIEATRQMLRNCVFDAERCKAGVRALQNYRRAFNDKLDQFKAVPVHDWASHGSDAFGEGAININKMHEASKPKPIPLGRRSGWMS